MDDDLKDNDRRRRWLIPLLVLAGIAAASVLWVLYFAESEEFDLHAEIIWPHQISVLESNSLTGIVALDTPWWSSAEVTVYAAEKTHQVDDLPEIIDRDEARELANSPLEGSGLFELTFAPLSDWEDSNVYLVVVIRVGADRAFFSKTLNLSATAPLEMTLNMDRPLYQPGQTMLMRTVVLDADERTPKESQAVQWRVHDSRGDLVFDHVTETDSAGISAAEFELPDPSPPGKYRIIAESDGAIIEEKVTVVPYRQLRFPVADEVILRSVAIAKAAADRPQDAARPQSAETQFVRTKTPTARVDELYELIIEAHDKPLILLVQNRGVVTDTQTLQPSSKSYSRELNLGAAHQGLTYLLVLQDHRIVEELPIWVRQKGDDQVNVSPEDDLYGPGDESWIDLSFPGATSVGAGDITYGVVAIDETLHALKERADIRPHTEDPAVIARRIRASPYFRGEADVAPEIEEADPQERAILPRTPETMIWSPSVASNADGSVRISFTVPDEVTTWHIMVWAHSRDGQLGLGEAQITVAQPVFLDIELPTHMTDGDVFRIPATIVNSTDEEITVQVDVRAENALRTMGSGTPGAFGHGPIYFDHDDRLPRLLKVEANERKNLILLVHADGVGPGELAVNLRAGGTLIDSEDQTVTVASNDPQAPLDEEGLSLSLIVADRQIDLGTMQSVTTVIENRTSTRQDSLIIEIPIPPGAFVPRDQFEALVEAGAIDHFEISPTHVRIHHEGLAEDGEWVLDYSFAPLVQGQMTLPPLRAYRSNTPLTFFAVDGGKLVVD